MQPPTVRAATGSDAAGIAEVHVRSWQAAYAGQLPDELLRALSVGDRQRTWEQRLSELTEIHPAQAHSQQNGRTLVIEVEGAVGGFASVGPCRDDGADERTGELWALYLHPRYWNRGLGRRLHDEAITVLSGQGCHRAVLWVLRTNVRAQRFYQRAGWARDGAVKVDHLRGVALDEVRYARSLDPAR
ncbi:MAG TPA: GNAT family N-acetyltransferase [Pseudonocardiaceae bacterium]|nr:GNAT family N-acetyltransferase [Pseudonocardiaceae bacterium]